MSRLLQSVFVCGAGPRGWEAHQALAALGVAVEAFITLPWEQVDENLSAAKLIAPRDLEDSAATPVLLATERPRKARKLLREHCPQRLVLNSFTAFLEALGDGLRVQHPALFPARDDPDSRRVFAYDKGLLPNKYLALLEQDVKSLEQAHARSGLSIGYPGWNLLYYSCLCSLRPQAYNLILETGTNVGSSTIVLAQALKDSRYQGTVLSADLDTEALEQAAKNLALAGLEEQVALKREDGVAFLESRGGFLDAPGLAVSFAFLDDCHEAEHVLREFVALHPWLDAHSVVFFDNVDDPEGVAGALAQIKARFGGNVVRFENCSWHPPGQAIWQSEGLQGVSG